MAAERKIVEIIGDRCFGNPSSNPHCRLDTLPQELLKLVAEAKAEEREACAQLACPYTEEQVQEGLAGGGMVLAMALRVGIAEQIRGRTPKEG
jgi:hypothetical protein